MYCIKDIINNSVNAHIRIGISNILLTKTETKAWSAIHHLIRAFVTDFIYEHEKH